ncbi:unnamed protein product [Caenorhabditis nigoni]
MNDVWVMMGKRLFYKRSFIRYKKECITIDNKIRVGPFPQGSVDVQSIADKTGIQYDKANRRIKKDERSKLPRAPGQKLQQREKIIKDLQCQL